MKLKIVTPEKLVLETEADSVTLPGTEGQMTILKGHAALAATLKAGPMYYHFRGQPSEPISLGPGFVEVLHNQVTLMVL